MKSPPKHHGSASSVPKLTDGHRDALVATDVFFGGFCVLSLVLSIGTAITGRSTWIAPAAIFGFLVANVLLSQISLRVKNAYTVEILRVMIGALIVPAAYILVDGPLGPWWPGSIIMSLGGTIVLGLITQRPFWGRLLSVWYVILLAATMWFTTPNPDWYKFAVEAGVVAMIGLLFAGIMSQLGQALHKEHERSLELTKTRDALFAEMEVAQEIQTLLLPKAPRMEGIKIEGRMVPASEVGGDYYDVIELEHHGSPGGGGRVFAAIGDVSGHGVTSGLTMMMARASLVGALEANPTASLPELYSVLNRCICQNMKRMDLQMYMTFALLEHHGDGAFSAVGCHLPLLVHRAATGEVEHVDLEGAWLGVVDNLTPESLPTREIQLEPGDTLVLYTDGILEHGADGEEMYGVERLTAHIKASHALEPAEVVDDLLKDLERHHANQEDDVTILLVRRETAVSMQNAAIHELPLNQDSDLKRPAAAAGR